jgi:hypothetical protein
MIAATKGLIASGVAPDKVKAAEQGSKQRYEEIMKTCGALQ